ncbi:MAG TPA: hypothetical protein VGO18_10995, partial [Steroidobacteraceae bacterium]|nr:hypothetical protein [Steroidobacteraceae bacterium]
MSNLLVATGHRTTKANATLPANMARALSMAGEDGGMVTKRVNVLWAIVGVVGGMALGAWNMGSRIQSPAEMAARTKAPEPSPILVPVESRVLSSDVV